jgi:hypothetical protein
VEDVLCLTCGGVLRRERDSAGTPNGGPAFQWFDLRPCRIRSQTGDPCFFARDGDATSAGQGMTHRRFFCDPTETQP